MLLSLLTLAIGFASVQAGQICSDRVIKSSKIITTSTGAHLNFTNFACAGAPTVAPIQARDMPLMKARELEKRAASECTGTPCQCGAACGSTQCARPPAAISTNDCTSLVTELLNTAGVFVLPAATGGQVTLGSCEYVAFNNFANTAAEFCFDDFGEGSLALLTACGDNEAQCTGTGNQFFYEQLSS